MEGEVELRLEPGHVARRLAREADLDRQVEEDRQVRVAGRRSRASRARAARRAGRRRRSPGRPASSRRTGRRSTDGPRRAPADDLVDELPAGGVEQERVGQRIGPGRRAGPGQQELADPFAEPGPARLAGQRARRAASAEMRARRSAWVVLPAPSGPSIVMNQPRRSGARDVSRRECSGRGRRGPRP